MRLLQACNFHLVVQDGVVVYLARGKEPDEGSGRPPGKLF
jgi:hypothetical protein